MAYLCGIAIFLSAFLLFQIQPLIARCFLPWFGGIPSVWTTCMLFFECVLLAGYGYSHWMAQKVRPQRQAKIHCVLLGVAVLILAIQFFVWKSPLLPAKSWAPKDNNVPLTSLLFLLLISVGIPYLMTSTTGPLLQSWFARLFPGRPVYRLYALSNAGSLLALLSYPLLLEPHFKLRTQALLWGCGFILFTILCASFGLLGLSKGVCSKTDGPSPAQTDANDAGQVNDESADSDLHDVPSPADWMGWTLLATLPSAALLAVTSQITMEVSPIPLLWVVPMVIYLSSFILTFDTPKFYVRSLWSALLVISAAGCALALYLGHAMPIMLQLCLFLTFLGATCMLCHGEMANRKPSPKYLTGFYLAMSLGGALGGVIVGVFAPLLFKGFWEVNFSIIAALLAMLFTMRSTSSKLCRGLAAFGALLISLPVMAEMLPSEGTLENFRDFYGKYSIKKTTSPGSAQTMHLLLSGKTKHGVQINGPENMKPLSYYHRNSGIGLLLDRDRSKLNKTTLHVGLVGLGIGTLAAYAHEGDKFDFYELSPAVIDLAWGKNGYFSFLSQAKGIIQTFAGDARLSLEQRASANHGGAAADLYDIIVLDAFSSDSIPAHLLTLEAFESYLQLLAKDGIIAVHISNRFIDLLPVLQAAAQKFSLTLYRRDDYNPINKMAQEPGNSFSDWVLMFRHAPEKAPNDCILVENQSGLLWTDDYTPLLPLISWSD